MLHFLSPCNNLSHTHTQPIHHGARVPRSWMSRPPFARLILCQRLDWHHPHLLLLSKRHGSLPLTRAASLRWLLVSVWVGDTHTYIYIYIVTTRLGAHPTSDNMELTGRQRTKPRPRWPECFKQFLLHTKFECVLYRLCLKPIHRSWLSWSSRNACGILVHDDARGRYGRRQVVGDAIRFTTDIWCGWADRIRNDGRRPPPALRSCS